MTASAPESPSKEMRWFAWSLVAIILALALAAAVATIRAERPIVVATTGADDLIPEADMNAQTLRTEWTSSRGTEEVITSQLSGESDEAHAARHNAKVALQQELWPPV